ncbi:hypothetical protein D3C81_2002260 [compost metagenome]
MRLGQAYPILFLYRAQCKGDIRHLQADRLCRFGDDGCLVCFDRCQCDHAAMFPRGFCRFHAGFAEQGLLGISAEVSVFYRD